MIEKLKNLNTKTKVTILTVIVIILIALLFMFIYNRNKTETTMSNTVVEQDSNLSDKLETVSNNEIDKESSVSDNEIPETVSENTVSDNEITKEPVPTEEPVESDTIEVEESEVLGDITPTPPVTTQPSASNTFDTSKVDPHPTDGGPDSQGNTWYKKHVWTASNGYQIKIHDGIDYENYIAVVNGGYSNDVYDDGEVYAPKTAAQDALFEFIYDKENTIFDKAYAGGSAAHKGDFEMTLPEVDLVGSYQTTILKTDNFQAYCDALEPYINYYQSGHNDALGATLSVDRSGLTFYTNAGGATSWKFQNHSKRGDAYRLTIYKNLVEIEWKALKASLRMITPDAEALYTAIYDACYYGDKLMTEYDTWYTVGSTQVMSDSTSQYCVIYIKQ